MATNPTPKFGKALAPFNKADEVAGEETSKRVSKLSPALLPPEKRMAAFASIFAPSMPIRNGMKRMAEQYAGTVNRLVKRFLACVRRTLHVKQQRVSAHYANEFAMAIATPHFFVVMAEEKA